MSEPQKKAEPKRVRSEKRIREKKVEVRLSRQEHEHLVRLSKIANTTPQTVLRTLLMDQELKPARIYPDEVYRAIIGLGRNWNQAVTKLHSTGQIPPESVEGLLQEVKEIRQCLSSR